MPSFKPSMLNYHDHYYYLVVFITTDACLAEWYLGLRQICGLNCYLFLAEVALVVGFLLLFFVLIDSLDTFIKETPLTSRRRLVLLLRLFNVCAHVLTCLGKQVFLHFFNLK